MFLVVDFYEDRSPVVEAARDALPDATVHQFPEDGTPALEDVEGVYLSGGNEPAHGDGWAVDARAFVGRLIEERVPTLGVCLGHQFVHAALGGEVAYGDLHCGLARASFGDDPLFAGVGPAVPVLHRGLVTVTGEGMEVIATADHDPAFATRHRDAPVWSVQYHPDFLEEHVPLVEDDWTGGESWADCTAERTITNFARLARGEEVRAVPDAGDGAVAGEGDGR